MNRIRKLAQELIERYPELFSADFNQNKQALAQVSIIRSTAVRNQLAGAITSLVRDSAPQVNAPEMRSEQLAEGKGEIESEQKENPELTQAAQN